MALKRSQGKSLKIIFFFWKNLLFAAEPGAECAGLGRKGEVKESVTPLRGVGRSPTGSPLREPRGRSPLGRKELPFLF
jgi:hypothetical protein